MSLLVLVALLASGSLGTVEPVAITGGRDAALESARELSAAFAKAVRDLVCEDLGSAVAGMPDGVWQGWRDVAGRTARVAGNRPLASGPELREALLDLPPPALV